MPDSFEPIGEKARWRILVDWVLSGSVGDVITYEQLTEALQADGRADIHRAVWYATPKLEEDHSRTLETIRGVGYRIADVRGHLRRARTYGRRSRASLVRGHSAVAHVDLNGVDDPELRREVDAQRAALAAQLEFHKRTQETLARHERELARLAEESAQTQLDAEDIRARLERLEKLISDV